jgi:hypothetical protein
MKKTMIIALSLIYSVILITVAKAEISFSGYQEFYMGSADQSKIRGLDATGQTNTSFNGFSNGRFTRIIATGKTKLDNGIDVIGVINFSKDDGAGDSDTQAIAVDQNDIGFSGDFGNIHIGNMFTAGSMMHFRGTTLIPTAEPDNDQRNRFATMATATMGRMDEIGFAFDGMKVRYMSNVYDGFSFGVSYEPCMTQTSANASATDCNSSSAPTNHFRYTDFMDYVLKYQTEVDGVGIGLTYGYQTANSHILNNVEYNDAEGTVYSGQLTYGGLTAIVRHVDLGDSGQIKTNTDDGDETGDTYAIRYDAGNFSVGFARVETSIKITSQSSPNEDNFNAVGLGYKLGGGVTIEGAYEY